MADDLSKIPQPEIGGFILCRNLDCGPDHWWIGRVLWFDQHHILYEACDNQKLTFNDRRRRRTISHVAAPERFVIQRSYLYVVGCSPDLEFLSETRRLASTALSEEDPSIEAFRSALQEAAYARRRAMSALLEARRKPVPLTP